MGQLERNPTKANWSKGGAHRLSKCMSFCAHCCGGMHVVPEYMCGLHLPLLEVCTLLSNAGMSTGVHSTLRRSLYSLLSALLSLFSSLCPYLPLLQIFQIKFAILHNLCLSQIPFQWGKGKKPKRPGWALGLTILSCKEQAYCPRFPQLILGSRRGQ